MQQKNPELSKTEIRKLAPDVYAWLYRHDKPDGMASLRIWLNNHSPKLQKPKSPVNRVDWNARDKKNLAQAKSSVEQLLQKDKPVGITVGRVGSSLGLKGLFDKHLDKLPRTKAYLASIVETVEDFQIRRVEWAIAELDRRGEEVMTWKILRLVCLRPDCSDKIGLVIEKALKYRL